MPIAMCGTLREPQAHEDAYKAECDQTAHYTCENEQQGRSAPFLIRMGRRKLSMVPTTKVQMRRNVPQPVLLLQ